MDPGARPIRKLPSIRTVAKVAGVSTATVSNVLNARRSVAPELVERVRKAVVEVGYIADMSAARLRSRRSTVAGVLVPDIANPFFGALVAELETAARRDGYDLLVVSSGDDPATETARLRALLSWRPAGVIVVPCDDTLPGRAIAQNAGVPLIAADRIPTEAAMDVVSVDNQAASAAVARHLVAGGRRRLLVAAADPALGNINERVQGVRAGAAGSEATVEVLKVGFTLGDSRARLQARLAEPPLPDAVFALNNMATLSALDALQARGLRVPQDVALVSFDDADWMTVVSPPLTAVRQPIEAMAQAAWARLLARIAGDTSPPQLIRLGCQLECRESTAPVARRAGGEQHRNG